MRKLLPVLLALSGLAGGTGAGLFLKPAVDADIPAPAAHATAEAEHPAEASETTAEAARPDADLRRSDRQDQGDESAYEYVKLNNQFVVPVVHETRVSALVVMSLSVEVSSGQKEVVFSREPKLRDAFLQVLFNHANSGGFDGAFTTGEKMGDLRGSLFAAALDVLGPIASDVLVIDIVRQDV